MSKRTSEDAGLGDNNSEVQPKKLNLSCAIESSSTTVTPMEVNDNELMISAIGKKGARDQMQDRHHIDEKIKQQIPVCGMYCYQRFIDICY